MIKSPGRVSQLVGASSPDQKVGGLISIQGTYLGCGFHSQSGQVWKQPIGPISLSLSHTHTPLCSSLSKINKHILRLKINKKKRKKKNSTIAICFLILMMFIFFVYWFQFFFHHHLSPLYPLPPPHTTHSHRTVVPVQEFFLFSFLLNSSARPPSAFTELPACFLSMSLSLF